MKRRADICALFMAECCLVCMSAGCWMAGAPQELLCIMESQHTIALAASNICRSWCTEPDNGVNQAGAQSMCPSHHSSPAS